MATDNEQVIQELQGLRADLWPVAALSSLLLGMLFGAAMIAVGIIMYHHHH